jgi:hypothetical protein
LTKVGVFLSLLNTKIMDILEKLQAFIQASNNDKDILIAKEKDRLTLELYSLLIKAEKKGYIEGIGDFKIK